MTARKGLNTITSSSGVVLDITNKTLAGLAIADFPELASTANAKGASLIGLEDSGGLFTATEVEAALAENRALINSNSLGLGAFWECVAVIADSAIDTRSGEQTIDGVLTSASRVLLTAETDSTKNGLWLTAAGAWSRTTDADASADFTVNKTVCAMMGTKAGETWAYTGDSEPTLESDALTFVMKSGSNIADGSITAAKLASDAVTTVKILDDNVTQAKMAKDSVGVDELIDGSVGAVALASDSVTTNKILDNNVTLAKMAANSVDSDQYVDGSIDTEHLAAGAVDTTALGADAVNGDKIADDSIGSEHLAAGAVDTTALGADAVDGSKIADDAVDSEHLAAGAVDTTALGADAVDGSKIADAAVDSEHLAAQAENNKAFITTINYDSGASNTLISSCPNESMVARSW